MSTPRRPWLPRQDSLLHAKVQKEFKDGYFNGTVVRRTTAGYFHVKYDDDDSEDLSADEAQAAAKTYQAYLKRHHQDDITIISIETDTPSYAIEYVKDANGVAQEIARGDLVRILSARSTAYEQVGHVRGLTQKRVKVYLTDRDFDRAFDPKNLLFLEPSTSPAAQAYHKKWKTNFSE